MKRYGIRVFFRAFCLSLILFVGSAPAAEEAGKVEKQTAQDCWAHASKNAGNLALGEDTSADENKAGGKNDGKMTLASIKEANGRSAEDGSGNGDRQAMTKGIEKAAKSSKKELKATLHDGASKAADIEKADGDSGILFLGNPGHAVAYSKKPVEKSGSQSNDKSSDKKSDGSIYVLDSGPGTVTKYTASEFDSWASEHQLHAITSVKKEG